MKIEIIELTIEEEAFISGALTNDKLPGDTPATASTSGDQYPEVVNEPPP